jgi:hypothetical protein
MGRLNGLYREEFPVGTRVRIKATEILEEFRRTWQLHHPISGEQVRLGGHLSVVAGVSFYHGGDELYKLTDAPAIWHEQLLDPA